MVSADSRPYHVPLLINEVLLYVDPKPSCVYVDATFGAGGHSRAILQAQPKCCVVAIDWDRDAIDMHEAIFKKEFGNRIQFIWGNFAQLDFLLRKNGIELVDGIVADFGTSQHQIFSDRGFSFLVDSPLDMRMSPAHQKVTAAQVLNNFSEAELVRIFKDYGQEKYARSIARAILSQRVRKPFKTTKQLADLVERCVVRKNYRIHPATKIFQALRIYVNHELESIERFLNQTSRVLNNGGRLVCISFHALEDGLVKQFLRDHIKTESGSGFELLTKHAVLVKAEEVSLNPSARSARLRAAIFRK